MTEITQAPEYTTPADLVCANWPCHDFRDPNKELWEFFGNKQACADFDQVFDKPELWPFAALVREALFDLALELTPGRNTNAYQDYLALLALQTEIFLALPAAARTLPENILTQKDVEANWQGASLTTQRAALEFSPEMYREIRLYSYE